MLLIGIDDTDMPNTPGTGRLARSLVEQLVAAGATHRGITAHQLFLDPIIPCTGHNRAICLAIDWPHHVADLEFVFDRIRAWAATGSDPAVCLAESSAVSPVILEWGTRALSEILSMPAAQQLAGDANIDLRPLAGTGLGVIGALAAVGLRASGNHGHFADLPGLRDLPETVSPQTLAAMGIVVYHADASAHAKTHATYKTLGHVRPKLLAGQPVLPVQWSDEHDAWIPVDRKKSHPLDPD